MSEIELPLTDDDLIFLDACPVCSEKKSLPFLERPYAKRKLKFYMCESCTGLYMNPRPKADWYSKLYSEYFWEIKSSSSGIDVSQFKRQWNIALRRAEKFIEFLNKTGKLNLSNGSFLEIGCAYGLIGRRLADEYGSQVYGVEPSKTASKFANEKLGVEILGANFQDVANQSDQKFDMIVMSHVLENVIGIHDELKVIAKALKPTGCFLIETPNPYFARGTHIYHPHVFTPRALDYLLRKNGLRPIHRMISGRPRSVMSAQYTTILAVPDNSVINDPIVKGASVTNSIFLMRAGNKLHSLLKRRPMGWIDGYINSRKSRVSSRGRSILEKLTRS